MTRSEARAAIVGALGTVAPEVDVASLDDASPLREQVDLDSMDFLRFVTELHRSAGVDVPEADYGRLTSIATTVDYLLAQKG